MARFLPEDWPIPAIDNNNRDFFTTGKLMVQQCTACGTVQHPPEDVCHQCLGMEFRGLESAGKGTVYSYIVVHNPPAPSFANRVPYAVALVSLDDFPHVRVLGNVLNRPASAVAIGQKVRVTFEQIDDEEADVKLLMPQWEAVDQP